MERIVYDKMNVDLVSHFTMAVHLRAYSFAYMYIHKKTILDAACGTCFGSMIFSTGAKSIIAIDKSKEAIAKGKKLKFFCPITYLVKDLDKDLLPEADICVSIETIEHLDGDGFFLKNLKTNHLIFSVPIESKTPGGYHKLIFHTPKQAIDYLHDNKWRVVLSTNEEIRVSLDYPGLRKMTRSIDLMGIAERFK